MNLNICYLFLSQQHADSINAGQPLLSGQGNRGRQDEPSIWLLMRGPGMYTEFHRL
jgi:hypothetical protein